MEHKRNIVPLLIDGFKFNKTAKKYLTGKLADLPKLNGLHVPHGILMKRWKNCARAS
ncbi:MAG: hypothetical protein U0703_28540 [Anaerolineae bacterium]